MSSFNDERPLFVYRLKTPFVRNLVVWAVAFAVFAILLNSTFGYIAFAILFVALALVQYFILQRRFSSWRMELYDEHYKIFFQGDLTQDTDYSEIDRIESKRRAFRRFHFLYAKKDNRLLTTIQLSNQKYKELQGLTLFDWLIKKITPSTETKS